MYKYFFNRKVAFLKEADAVALFPGGFGTLDEAMETLTLVQTGKHNLIPIVLVDDPECPYWSHLIKFFEDELLAHHYISRSDLALFERVWSVDAAVEKIQHFYSRYHSMRYVHGQLVIRLTSQLTPDAIRKLTDQFQDIILPGGRIFASESLEAEKDDVDTLHMPRLVIDFNRMDFGRLRSLIDSINDA